MTPKQTDFGLKRAHFSTTINMKSSCDKHYRNSDYDNYLIWDHYNLLIGIASGDTTERDSVHLFVHGIKNSQGKRTQNSDEKKHPTNIYSPLKYSIWCEESFIL